MLTQMLLPLKDQLTIEQIYVDKEMITIEITTNDVTWPCPDCRQPSQRVHSRYWRTVADLPWADKQILLQWQVRRLFCDVSGCQRKTFAQQLPEMVARYARRTKRLNGKQRQIGLALGGEAGSRLSHLLKMGISSATILRLIRTTPQQNKPTPRIVGVDEWAWRKGRRYGTILVDLERHQPVELLPERTSESLAAWLKAHPEIKVVSRDRAQTYIDGINQGAPQAIQVADRWHLLKNLKEALIRVLERNRVCLYAAAAENEPEIDQKSQSEPESAPQDRPLSKLERQQQDARARRLARYQAVMELHQQGLKIQPIARRLGLARKTVMRYINAGTFPERSKPRKRPTILDPYRSYLSQRWDQGEHNARQLYREIVKRGYPGSRKIVSNWATKKRNNDPGPTLSDPLANNLVGRPWAPQFAVWLLIQEPATLSSERQAALHRMLNVSDEVTQAYAFAQAFLRMVRQRLSKALEPWVKAVVDFKVSQLNTFAQRLMKDKAAVLAALSLPWSNGPVEGHVNRLKLIKHQMYGRANFDLLRLRVLASSPP